MKHALIGSSFFTWHIANLFKHKFSVVVTESYNQENDDHVDMRAWCNLWDIKVSYDLHKSLNEYQPDIVWAIGYRRYIPPEILHSNKWLIIGYHPSPLPKGRGCSPIIWAHVKKWDTTGSTFFKMAQGIDDGPIMDQRIIPVEKTPIQTYRLLLAACIEQFRFLLNINVMEIVPTNQNESEATYFRRRKKGVDEWIEYL